MYCSHIGHDTEDSHNRFNTVIRRADWMIAIALSLMLNLLFLSLISSRSARLENENKTVENAINVEIVSPRLAGASVAEQKNKTPERPKPNPSKTVRPRPQAVNQSHVSPKKDMSQPQTPSPPVREAPVSATASDVANQQPGDLNSPSVEGASSVASTDARGVGSEYGTGDIDAPLTPISQTPPLYPIQARRRGIEGRVVVRYVVNERGTVENIRIIEEEPPGVFDETVIRGVSAWRFTPGTVQGVPVRTWAEAEFPFTLERSR